MVSSVDKVKIYPKKDGTFGCQVSTHFPADPDEFPVVATVYPLDKATFQNMEPDEQRDYFLSRVSVGMTCDFRYWSDSHSWSCRV